MATGNNRDVRLGIEVETRGEGGVARLGANLRGLGDAAGDSTPELDRLGAELDRLAAATEARRRAEAAARTESTAARAGFDQQRDALARLRAESDRATRGTTEYRDAERQLRLAVVDARIALRDKQAAVIAAATGARTAAAAERQLADTIKATAAAARASASAQVQSLTPVSQAVQTLTGQLSTLRNVAGVALGGTLVGSLARDVAATADAYNNLAARIRIVTGEGAAFDQAFSGVFDVAQRTGAAVEEVGALFTKLATAGKQLNLSNADALALTESITQATALSGANAQGATAAITQFSQAIASGVLRGEELNSILEQSPRLARALADGLGVTTGELRKLGEAGTLTGERVILALQGQSRALQAEFNQLPPTVGRAISALSNAWTVYVGEVDKATGASSTAAAAITTLAANLDSVGAVLYSVGKAAAAYTALRLAQSFIEGATAARAAAAATAVATTATTAHTAATAANTAAQSANAAAIGATAASAGRFAAVLSTVKTFALIGVLTNLREIGTAIGEGAARFMGYGKAIEAAERAMAADEAATRANAAAKAELAQKTELAAEKAFGLTDQSRKLVGEFVSVTSKGGDAATALDKVSKALELGSLSGVQAAGIALDDLARKGLVSGAAIRDALAGALKNEDLGVFRVNALAAFDASENGARRLKAALDAIATESLRRAGTSLGELTSGFSAGAIAAANDVDALAQTLQELKITGDDAGRALAGALDKALSAASTERAVKAVEERFEALGKQGLITGDQLAAGLDKAKQKADELRPGVNSLAEALRAFGLQTREELQATADRLGTAYQAISGSVQVSLADQRKAFELYAAAAIAANGGVESSAVKVARAMLETREAALGAGKAGADAGAATSAGFDAAGASITRAGDALDVFSTKARNAAMAADSAADDKRRNSANSAAGAALGGDPFFELLARKNQGRLGADDLDMAQAVFQNFKNNLTTAQQAPPGAYSIEARRDAQVQFNQARLILDEVRALAAPGGAGAPAVAPSGAGGSTVNITLAGRTRAVRVASQGDANTLASLLQELQDDAARVGG